MPFCGACGKENPEIAKFCLACGASLAAPEPLPEEERKVVTALFTDIVGSTATAERLDPEDVRARLAPYYARVRKELESFGGTVEKFIGDAVVALFGAPVAHEDDPERAVRAALAVQRAVAELNAHDSWLDLHLRTAVHTGEALVVVGARATEGEGTAAGDVMNTAARLQGGAPVDGIVVGEATFRATRHAIEYREAEPVQAKGKSEPIPIWEVVAERGSMPRPAGRTPLVGRDRELGELTRLWERARSELRPQLATIVAPPGIGKSRLLVAFCELIESTAAVRWGRCLSYGEGMTYWPIAEILKDAAGILHDDSMEIVGAKIGTLVEKLGTTDADELRTIAAALANVIGVPTTPRGTYSALEISQSELHWGIRRVLQLLAEQRPLVLMLEDLHWAEPTLLELINQLLADESPTAIFVVASARPELGQVHADFLASSNDRHVLELMPLGEEESRRLLVELVGPDAPDTAVLERLLANAAGNPLFLEETVRMVADVMLLDGDAAVDALPIPSSLNALIGARLDALPAREKRVAQQASVVGGVFWQGAVAHLDGTGGDLSPSLDTLEQRDFVHAHGDSTVAGEREYAFKHILIRDVAYERLPKGRRAELHVRFCDWLSGLTGEDEELVEILAYHLEQACHLARSVARSPVSPPVHDAVNALTRAGEKAERREGMREAERFYSRALDVAGDEHPLLSAELRLRRARALAALGRLKPAQELLLDLADEADADVRGSALVLLANLAHRQGRAREGLRRLTEAEEIANATADRRLQIRTAFALAAVRGDLEGAFAEAADHLRRAVSIAEEIDDRALRVEGHLRLGFLLFNMGELEGSERELLRVTDLAGELGSRRDEARASFQLALVHRYRGRLEEGEQLALQAREWLERTGETFFQVQNLIALAQFALLRDEVPTAEERLHEALPLALEEGGWLVLEVYRLLVEALVREGRLDDAEEILGFAERDPLGDYAYALAAVRLARATLAVAQRAEEEARACYDEALRVLEESHLPIDLCLARVAYARALASFGDVEAAHAQLKDARETCGLIAADGLAADVDRQLA
ncbi:MAG: AAA family ATPase, partial [Actinobacteria bacterium]|nr:AAA family ATPase [Actinomycetota bacterium]